MSRYIIHRTKSFNRVLRSLVKKNNPLLKYFEKAVKALGVDPFSAGLKSHKVNSLQYGEVYSSRVTGDIRILWDFDRDGNVILLLTVGGN